jgi:hypothetical protein
MVLNIDLNALPMDEDVIFDVTSPNAISDQVYFFFCCCFCHGLSLILFELILWVLLFYRVETMLRLTMRSQKSSKLKTNRKVLTNLTCNLLLKLDSYCS